MADCGPMMSVTVEIRRECSGILRACPVSPNGVRGTNLLRGKSLTNVESAKTEVQRRYWDKIHFKTGAESNIALEINWQVVA